MDLQKLKENYPLRSIFVAGIFLPVLLASCQPAAIAGAPGIGDTYYAELGNGGYDVQRYVISLEVDPEARLVNGNALIEATATERLASFNLDFQGLEIDSVMVNGTNTSYSRDGHELTITPAHPLKREKAFVTQIAYHGTPSPIVSASFPSDVGWFFGDSGAVNVLSEPDGASTWFPANDHPLDKALYRLEISVPQPWVVAATGTLLETTKDGSNTRFIFEMDSPMASYLAGVYIDHYQVDIREGPGDVMIRNVIPETVDASLTKNLKLLPDMLSYFASLFGPYPYTVYGVVIASPTIPPCDNPFGVALEAQTQSVHCPKVFMLSEAVLAHELAHQWFGNSVSLERWQDIWLKEGMATYAEWLWTARESGLAGLNELVATERDRFIIKAPIDQPAPKDLYGWQVYRGGALVLHDLRLRLGDEAFFKVLREYASRYKNSNAGLDDFIAEAQKASSTDLQPFFDAWLLDTELPEPQ